MAGTTIPRYIQEKRRKAGLPATPSTPRTKGGQTGSAASGGIDVKTGAVIGAGGKTLIGISPTKDISLGIMQTAQKRFGKVGSPESMRWISEQETKAGISPGQQTKGYFVSPRGKLTTAVGLSLIHI